MIRDLIAFIRANGGFFASLQTGYKILRNDGAGGLLRVANHLVKRFSVQQTPKVTQVASIPMEINFESISPSREQTEVLVLGADLDVNPQFSVIVPCYGQASFIFDNLRSVAAATKALHEVIVIDDGNTSRSQLMLLKQIAPAAPHQKLVIVRQKNMGLGSARNSGILISRGSYIKFLDADDLLAPGSLDLEKNHLENGVFDIVISCYSVWNQEDAFFSVRKPFNNRPVEIQNVESLTEHELLRYWEQGLSIPIHSALFRREAIELFSNGMQSKEDFLFWLSVLSQRPKLTFLDKVVCIYRLHNQQMTLGSKTKNGSFMIEALFRFSEKNLAVESSLLRAKLKYIRTFYGAESVKAWSSYSEDRSNWLARTLESH
jgi:glycosyltransferase involved in cell wall biosynthesis